MDKSNNPNHMYTFPGAPSEEGIVFATPDSEISIEGHQELIWSILRLADGYNSRNDIVNSLEEQGLDASLVGDAYDDLTALGILMPSAQHFNSFRKFTSFPSLHSPEIDDSDIQEITDRPYTVSKEGQRLDFGPPIGEIAKLSERRESCRYFDNKPIDLENLGTILNNAYSLAMKPVPSAGALYPLKIFFIVSDGGSEYPEGYYQYDPTSNSSILFNPEVAHEELDYILNTSPSAFGAPIKIVVTADVSRQTEKYGDRGYIYSMIEVGHVAQNVELTAEELGLGAIEIGGFNNTRLITELELDENIEPVIVIGIGHPDTETQNTDFIQMKEKLTAIKSQFLGANKPVDSLKLDLLSESMKTVTFYHALAHYSAPNSAYGENDERFTSGTARTMALAELKAVMEAVERYQSGRIRIDVESSADKLDEPWIDPRNVKPRTHEQIENLVHTSDFDTTTAYQWVYGKYENSGQDVLVPIDLVFYPLNADLIGRKPYVIGDSSGVAAHTNRAEAVDRAILELVERDAIMRNWFSKKPANIIDDSLLNDYALRRVSYWKKQGYEVVVTDLSTEDVPITNVLVYNKADDYPYFTNGASAAPNMESAIDKALQEAELALSYSLYNENPPVIDGNDVTTPTDHGDFYFRPENKKYIEWLKNGKIIMKLTTPSLTEDLIKLYNPIVVDLCPDDDLVSVVRAIVPSLVPINFGIGTEYIAHPNSGVTQIQLDRDQIPHYFA